MRQTQIGLRGVLLVIFCLAESAHGTILQRQGMEALVAHHKTVVVVEVVDAFSYWNVDGSMILTDVQLKVERFLKGDAKTSELTVTLLGGSVGDLSTVILGGAELIPEKSYLLFLNEESLLPDFSTLTVREHCQGAFDIVESKEGELRVISQASTEALVPDASGESKVPGGAKGLLLEEALQSIYALSAQEVK